MTKQDAGLSWTQPGWFEQASAWIQAELKQQGIGLDGAIEQPHVRPWSTVLRVPTTAGIFFFKATAPVLAHEPALTQALSFWRPDCMPQVTAADLERGWMLMPDFGASLRSLFQAGHTIQDWHTILPVYAEMQIEMVDRRRDILTLGAFDRRLEVLPAEYELLLADTDALRIGQTDGLTEDEYSRLLEYMPRFEAMCEELAGFFIPETLHHDDFHDGNIFVRDGRYIFADWAESCVAHPFFSMVVGLRSIAYRFNLPEDAPEIAELRDIYLEPWTCYESRQNLQAAFYLANRVGRVCRALTWHRVVSGLDEALKVEHADAVPGWLQLFLEGETAPV